MAKELDQVFLILPDGRQFIGRALIVNDPIKIPSGSGRINAEFNVNVPESMEVAAVLCKLDMPFNERIHLL